MPYSSYKAELRKNLCLFKYNICNTNKAFYPSKPFIIFLTKIFKLGSITGIKR